MTFNTNRQKIKKRLEKTTECPKCGNRENVMVIPGADLTFFYCPICSRENEDNQTEKKYK